MRSLLLLPLLALVSQASALGVGDKAPELSPGTIIKGRAVALDHGIHIVDFWATWSDEVPMSIPQLSKLAKKYKDKLDVTGIAVAEQGDDPLGQVKKFVSDMGSKMDYNVAFDGEKGTAGRTWMAAANRRQLPTSFLVKDGVILWIGRPADGLDKAVEDVIQDKFDLAASKAKFDANQAKQAVAEAEARKKAEEMQKLLQPVIDAMQEGDVEGALEELDKLETKRPDLKPQLIGPRFGILAGSGNAKLVDFAKRLVADDLKDNAEALNSLAWSIVGPEGKMPKPNYDAALILAKRAAEVTKMKDGMILDTYALALFKTGDKAKAVELQTKAVELARTDKRVDAATMKEMEGRLEQFKKAKSSV
jgi:tetratricopeptide (TPR) repeat protein